ncbi:MAG: oxygenase MpaB family protein [Acidimicrobiales bacterium]
MFDWSDDALDALRGECDPEVDSLIEQLLAWLVAEGHVSVDQASARTLLGTLIGWLHSPEAAANTLLDEYRADAPALPEWVSVDELRRGGDFFNEYSLPICAALLCASLPIAYSAARGSQVLLVTTELMSDARRRLAETTQMVFDVAEVGAAAASDAPHPLAPGSRGLATCRNVRLFHAAVRCFVRRDPDGVAGWASAERQLGLPLGEPINQEDLIGTLLTFGPAVLEALEEMGIRYDRRGAAGYLHLWSAAGHLLGVRPDLLPLEGRDAHHVHQLIRRRHQLPSRAGAELADALLAEMRRTLPLPLAGLAPALIRRLAGPKTADMLDIRDAPIFELALDVAAAANRALSPLYRFAPMRLVTDPLMRRVLRNYQQGGLRAPRRGPFDFTPVAVR